MSPLMQLIIEEIPSLVGLLKNAFAGKHPNLPQPTSAEVLAEFEATYQDSYARGELLKAALAAEV